MDVPHNQVFLPSNLPELFNSWARFPDAELYAGGTDLLHGQGKRIFTLPTNLISLGRIEELRRITRTERYLELGAMVSLGEALALGKIVPEALVLVLRELANPQVRNLATLGGNICVRRRRMDTVAALSVLDARYEIRNSSSARWVSAGRFAMEPELLGPQELVSRIRIPLEYWDYTVHRKFRTPYPVDVNGGSIVFIARAQKNILSEVRLAFAGKLHFRDRDVEASLTGKSLPLANREVQIFMERWKNLFSERDYPSGLLRDRILNFILYAINSLAD